MQPASFVHPGAHFEANGHPNQGELAASSVNELTHVSSTSGTRRDKINPNAIMTGASEQPREEKKSLEFAICDLRTITKVTQMFELIKASGCQVGAGSLEQLLQHNRTDVNFKTMNTFEPSEAFTAGNSQVPLQRIGEHPSFDSDEEFVEEPDNALQPD